MDEKNFGHHGNEGPAPDSVDQDVKREQRPYWKRAHHDWRVWVSLFFMFAAITVDVLTYDLAFLPHA